MQLTRFSAAVFAVASVTLVACGGDDGGGGGIVIPDAKVFQDAAPVAPCEVPASVGTQTLGNPADRQAANWIKRSTSNAALIIFAVSIPLGQGTNDDLTVFHVKPTAAWSLNTPFAYVTDPTAQLAAGTAVSFMDENYDATAMTVQRELWAQSGGVTFSEIAQTMGANITFTTQAANYSEIDENGAVLASGCKSMVGALTVNLKQQDAVTLTGKQTLTPEEQKLQQRVERVIERMGLAN